MLEFEEITIEDKKENSLDHLSLTVPEGAIMCLVGGDHRGRSLVLEVASGNRKPDSGRVILDGIDLLAQPERLYTRVGYMMDQPVYYRDIKVYEYYEMVLSFYKIRGRNRRKRIEKVLSDLGMEEFGDHFVTDLPAEYKPLFSLGKAILHEPDWLLLDQPFSGLDALGRAKIVTFLLDQHEKGVSMLMNSEMYQDLLGFVTDIVVIENGKRGIYGQVEEVYENLLRRTPVMMKVLSGMDQALAVLKKNTLVDRVVVKDHDVIFRFRGEEMEEAQLLADLVREGALVQSYTRDRIRINEMFRR